jgi:hypothetical protein
MKIILLAMLLFVVAGCESESGSTSGSGTPPGDITGTIFLYDTLYGKMTDHSGIKVSVNTLQQTITDSKGNWTLPNVPVGTYSLTYEKAGFGTKKYFNIQHTGNGTLYLNPERYLSQIPKVAVDVIQAPFQDQIISGYTTVTDSNGIIQYILHHDTIPNAYAVYKIKISSGLGEYLSHSSLYSELFFSKQPNIDPSNDNSFDFSTLMSAADTISFLQAIYRDSLLLKGYKSGEKVFVLGGVLIPGLEAHNGQQYYRYGYYDFAEKKYIVTGYGQYFSEVKSFILP